jgi:hypothetical protein
VPNLKNNLESLYVVDFHGLLFGLLALSIRFVKLS